MGLEKRTYIDQETVITAENLNAIQDAIIALEDGLLSVENDKSGEFISITDAYRRGFRSLSIYGKTTQDGTPTPDAPVELVSVGGSGSITVNVWGENEAQSMTMATPNGLPGIPVASGGNYTDANGQQWLCDEIDLYKGVYVQRIERYSFAVADMNGSESYPGWRNAGIAKYYPDASNAIGRYGASAMCNIEADPSENVHINTKDGNDVLLMPNPYAMTQSKWKAEYPNLVYDLIVSIPTPIEHPMSEEELAAYAALHTYKDSTTVTNDAGAWMELEYVVDTKKYFDSFFQSSSGRLVNVALPASAWAGENNLYSQVVQIDGVTQYSKVDLLPSVEQLAIFHNKDVAFVTENEDGVVTIYAIGDKPTQDYTMQAQITEVAV